jgi:YHS domain-containing protein
MDFSFRASAVLITVLTIAGLSCSAPKEERQHTEARPAATPPADHVVPPAEGKEVDDIYGDSGKMQLYDVLSGKEIDREVFADNDGMRVYFHCPVCRDRFQLRASVYMNAIKKRHIILEDLSLPLAERITNEIFGEPGKPQSQDVISGKPAHPFVYDDYNGKRIFFCCIVSKGRFDKNKDLYLKAIKKRGIILEDTPKDKK